MNEEYLTVTDLAMLEALTPADIQDYLSKEQEYLRRAREGDRQAQVLYLVRWFEPWRSWIERPSFRGPKSRRGAFLEQMAKEEKDRMEDSFGQHINWKGKWWEAVDAQRKREAEIARRSNWGQRKGGYAGGWTKNAAIFEASLKALCENIQSNDARKVHKALDEGWLGWRIERKKVISPNGSSRTWGSVKNILCRLRKSRT
ncbi:MAG: hypothetical protein ACOYXN_13620 [Acidobacteriota bacterium]